MPNYSELLVITSYFEKKTSFVLLCLLLATLARCLDRIISTKLNSECKYQHFAKLQTTSKTLNTKFLLMTKIIGLLALGMFL